ncbi:MAG: YicC/YloC family endoribonuclease, partial [bacterium]|jgi:uncharacterized protein (TIGR00255 family)
LKSMTGFGLASSEYNQKKINVEIRSLNSKFLELNIKLPRTYSDKESIIRNDCVKFIERGKANVSIGFEQNAIEDQRQINKELFYSYYNQLKSLADELSVNNTDIFRSVISIPEVFNTQEQNTNDEEWLIIHNTFLQAVENFNQFRIDEGNTLSIDLVKRIESILNGITEVEKFEGNRVPQIKEKLNQLLADQVGVENVDQNRLEQELIYYIEKFDITEEKIRLSSHCNYFLDVMKQKEANGKKLGFISQEIGREINTMGSKANDANIQKIVVGMKDELEKIKEQLLNII